jgi:hypothetical protein
MKLFGMAAAVAAAGLSIAISHRATTLQAHLDREISPRCLALAAQTSRKTHRAASALDHFERSPEFAQEACSRNDRERSE